MRNALFPSKMAEYMTVAQLRETGMLGAVVEQDSTLGTAQCNVELPVQKPQKVAKKVAKQRDRPITVEVKLLDVSAALPLLIKNILLILSIARTCYQCSLQVAF